MSLRLMLFFTKGVSLQQWDKIGLFDREVALYRRLSECGVHIYFVTYGDSSDLSYSCRLPGISILCNRYSFPLSLYWRLLPLIHARAIARTHVIKTNQTEGADIALAVARWWRKPLVARCGYMLSEFSVKKHGKLSKEARSSFALESHVFSNAQRVVVTTPMMAADLAGRFPDVACKTQIIPNYVDTDRFSPDPKVVPEYDLVTVGRLSPQKNHEALLQAVSGSSLRVLVIGNGELAGNMKRTVEASNGLVTWLPRVPHGELPQYLRCAKIFILPSLYEGHPKTLIEAMSCGSAVIGADVPGIREVLRHEQTGLLCGTGAVEIRRAVEILSAKPELRALLGHAARRFAIENYSLDRIVDIELKLLNEVANSAKY